MEKIFFIPRQNGKQKKDYNKLLLTIFCLPLMAGCMNTHTTQALAPAPPEESFSKIAYSTNIQPHTTKMLLPAKIEPAASADIIKASLSKETKAKKCKVNHRFDRKALIAYQWDRSRLGIDIDGVGVDWDGFSEFEAVKIEYRLKFSPEKTKREKCLYPSKWQGLIGSGYNEFFIRQENTVWEELKDMKKDLKKKINNYF
mgnify:CR=1 FL=1